MNFESKVNPNCLPIFSIVLAKTLTSVFLILASRISEVSLPTLIKCKSKFPLHLKVGMVL